MQKSTLLLAMGLAASAAVAAWCWRELRAERAHNVELSAQLEAVSRRSISLATPSPMVDSIPVPAQAVASASPASVATKSGPREVHGTQEEWADQQRRLLRDPTYRAARSEERRLELAARRDDAMRLLGFSAAEADAVIASRVEREMRWSEQPTSVVDTSPEGLQRMKEENAAQERQYQDQLRELVGEEKRARWQNYWESLGSRTRVDQLRLQLAGAEVLRDDQVEPLVTAIHSERAKLQQELAEVRESLRWQQDNFESLAQYHERKSELLKAANARTHSAALGILSRAQLARLDELMRQELEREHALQRLARASTKAEAPEPD